MNTFVVSIIGYSISAFLAASGSVAGPVVALVTTVLSVFTVASEANSNERAITNYRDNDVRWQAAIRAWERLFYCRRCDSLTDPVTRQCAPIYEIDRLLFAPERLQELPPADSSSLLTSPPDPNRLMIQAGAIGLVIAVITGVICSSQIAAHDADIQQAGAIHAAATNKAQQAISAASTAISSAPRTTDVSVYSPVTSDVETVKNAQDSLSQDLASADWSTEDEARISSDRIDGEVSTLQSDVVSLQQEIRAQASSSGVGIAGGTDTVGGLGSSSSETQPSAPAIEMRTKAGGGEDPGKIELP